MSETSAAKATHKTFKPAQASVLRIFAAATQPLTYDQVEAAMGIGSKTGIYSALGGLWNKGVIACVAGPVPVMSDNHVPQAVIDRSKTQFQLVSSEARALLGLLGLAS